MSGPVCPTLRALASHRRFRHQTVTCTNWQVPTVANRAFMEAPNFGFATGLSYLNEAHMSDWFVPDYPLENKGVDHVHRRENDKTARRPNGKGHAQQERKELRGLQAGGDERRI